MLVAAKYQAESTMRTIQHFRPDTRPRKGNLRLRPGIDRRTLEAFVPGVTAKLYDFQDDLQESTGNDIGDAAGAFPLFVGGAVIAAGAIFIVTGTAGGGLLLAVGVLVASQAQGAESDDTSDQTEEGDSEEGDAGQEVSEEEGGAIDVMV